MMGIFHSPCLVFPGPDSVQSPARGLIRSLTRSFVTYFSTFVTRSQQPAPGAGSTPFSRFLNLCALSSLPRDVVSSKRGVWRVRHIRSQGEATNVRIHHLLNPRRSCIASTSRSLLLHASNHSLVLAQCHPCHPGMLPSGRRRPHLPFVLLGPPFMSAVDGCGTNGGETRSS
jgi:hypothetical protein